MFIFKVFLKFRKFQPLFSYNIYFHKKEEAKCWEYDKICSNNVLHMYLEFLLCYSLY